MDAVSTVFIITDQEDAQTQGDAEALPRRLRQADQSDKRRFIRLLDAISFQWKLNQSCCLLSENAEDCNFYRHIAERRLHREEIHTEIKISFENLGGGGNDTGKELRRFVERECRPVLCLADTDQKYGKLSGHTPKVGKTLQHIQDAHTELDRLQQSGQALPPFQFFPLAVHEVENLIPLEILSALTERIPEANDQRETYQNGLAMLQRLKTLNIEDSRLENFRTGDPLLCYDFKNGLPYILPNEPERRIYWEIIISALGENDCSIPTQKRGVCKDQFFPPLHRRVLETAIAYLSEADHRFLPVELEPPLDHMWDEIGQVVFTWGCAATRSRYQ